MKFRDLTAALACLERVIAGGALDPVHREALQKAKRELRNIASSGRLDRQRVYRVIRMIAETLLEASPDK